ncbi:MAG TPA: allantoicase, partial [Devosiaceae bacterium]|nr:allantoicase [Devosiaceae bacterium]
MAPRPFDIPAFARSAINLASAGLGARGVFVTDEFFAPLERMLQDGPPVFIADKYEDNGKWMDGWESRRRRGGGHDLAVIRLAVPGRIVGFDVDTSYFTGNYPPACRIEGARVEADPDEKTEWTEILGESPLGPDAHHFMGCQSDAVWTHVRVHMLPDGGIARFRVFGEPELDRAEIGERRIDLASALHGGRALAFSDAHYGAYYRILAPGSGAHMGDGWETRRRRGPGHDWMAIALGARGTIEAIRVDTAHFKGNYPDACSVLARDLGSVEGELDEEAVAALGAWPELMAPQKLSADRLHEFDADKINVLGPVTHLV